MLTGKQVQYNGRDNTSCYTAGVNGGFETTPIPCAQDGGKVLSIDWATPCSQDGVSATSFSYEKAVNGTKPRADAFKTITVQNDKAGGSYGRWLVPDAYTISDFVTACCAGCTPIADVTVPAPIIITGECTKAAPTLPGCVYQGNVFVPAFTGTNDTYTATPSATDANGNPVTFSPATLTAASVAALAAAMTTNWSTELGSGTFTAAGQNILWTGTVAMAFGVSILQTDV